VNRLQPQSVQVGSSRSNESGRSCIPYESYDAQGKLGGVDGKVIKLAGVLVLEVMTHMRVDEIDSYEN
jgi:hypothetical protein